jgi:Holliday junction resolvasome RuvABC endonuclease subunit
VAGSLKVFTGDSLINITTPVYVGIDQSYSGFAITLFNKESHRTTVYKSEKRGIDRLSDIQAHLIENLVNYSILDVAIEGYAFGSQMANMLGELGGMVKLTLHDFGIYPLIVPPTNLKKYVTGKGNGIPKSQMLLYVYKKWGVEFTDDNAADAYSLARLVSGSHTLSYEKEVYEKLQDPKFREK